MYCQYGGDPTNLDPWSGTGRVAVGCYGSSGRRFMVLALDVAAKVSAFEAIGICAIIPEILRTRKQGQ
jgi:hypothetical protein